MNDWRDGSLRVLVGECRERLRDLADASVDALVTDLPAGISFMGASWDTFPTRHRAATTFADGRERPGIYAGQEHQSGTKRQFIDFLAEVMRECLRILKPGALGLVWAIPRTAHWTADALEEAGFEIHPNGFVGHLFGSGFPKHRTHLKPGLEVWWLVRKPGRSEGLNIEECRIGVGAGGQRDGEASAARRYSDQPGDFSMLPAPRGGDARGRWPANLALSHSQGCRPVPVHDDADAGSQETVAASGCEPGCPVAELDRQSGTLTSGFLAAGTLREGLGYRGGLGGHVRHDTIADSGGASRFF